MIGKILKTLRSFTELPFGSRASVKRVLTRSFRPQVGVLEDRVVPAINPETMAVVGNDTRATAELIGNTEGEADGRSGQIVPAGDVDFFKFEAQAGERILIEVTSNDGTFDASFEFLNSSGGVIASVDEFFDGGEESRAFDIITTGKYYIKVATGFSGRDGSYTAKVHRPGTLQFDTANITVDEGNNAILTVRRTGGLDETVSVDYELSGGTATKGDDFRPEKGMLTFAEGESVKTFVVSILPDNRLGDFANIHFMLKNPTNSANLGNLTTAVININDTTRLPTLVQVKKFRGRSQVSVLDNKGALRRTVTPFGNFKGRVVGALKDVDGNGQLDLEVKANIKGRRMRKFYFNV